MNKPFPAYTGNEPYTFVCYAHRDSGVVYPEIRWLQEQGVSVWYDEGIKPGREWSDALANAINGCSHFLYFITPKSVASENCRRELNFALEQDRPVLAIHLEQTEVPDGLRLNLNNRQAIYKSKLSENAYRQSLQRASILLDDDLEQTRQHGRENRIEPPRIRYAVRTDRAPTAYAVMGEGPVLIIPPGGTTHIQWYTTDTEAHEKFCNRLAEHRTVVLYDRHGYGMSDRNRTDFTADDDLKDLEAVIEIIGASTFDFLGISWGGGPTLAYASMHPERVRKIVLYGTGSVGQAPPSKKSLATNASLAALRRANFELYCKTMAIQFFPSGPDPETFASFGRMLRDSTSLEMAEQLDGIHLETQSLLSGINVPALVLHRRGDQCALFEWGQYLAQRLPNASFIPLDGDAHFPWVDDADSVLNPIIEFLTA